MSILLLIAGMGIGSCIEGVMVAIYHHLHPRPYKIRKM